MLKNEATANFELATQYLQASQNEKNTDIVIQILHKAHSIPLETGERGVLLRASILIELAKSYFDKTEYKRASIYNQESLQIRLEILGAKTVESLDNQMLVGRILYKQSQYSSALKSFNQIWENWKNLSMPTHLLANLHIDTAMCYRGIGDAWQSILHFQKALQIHQSKEKVDGLYIMYICNSIGLSYERVREPQKAMYYYQQAIDNIPKETESFHKYKAGLLRNLGANSSKHRKHQEAIAYYDEALKEYKLHSERDEYGLAHTYRNIGKTYSVLQNFSKALPYLQKALKLFLRIHEHKHESIAITYFDIAFAQFSQASHLPALNSCQKGLLAATNGFSEEDIYALPPLESIQLFIVTIGLLTKKAAIFRDYYLNVHSQSEHLKAAAKHIELAIQVIEKMRLKVRSEYSKMAIEREYMATFKVGLEVGFTFWQLRKSPKVAERAFRFAEKAKAVLLSHAMQGEISKIESPIPIAIQERENTLRTRLTDLNKSLQKEGVKQQDAAIKELNIQQLHVEILTHQRQYSELMDKLEKSYPAYYRLKYNTKTVSISEFQSLLRPKEILLQYNLYQNKLFVFAIGQNSVCFEEITPDSPLSDLVNSFQKAISLGNLEKYVSISLKLYNLLLQPIEVALEGKEKLLIVPDGVLHRLSFDALLLPQKTSNNFTDFSQLSYLIRQFEVQYHYSATLIEMAHQKKQHKLSKQVVDGFLGVAPIRFGKRVDGGGSGYMLKTGQNGRKVVLKSGGSQQAALQDLEETEAEVKTVYELFEEQEKEAVALFYDMASKDNLLQHIEAYKYVLLSTHGFADTENSVLSGLNLYGNEGENVPIPEDSKLYISDVMNLQLKADLVVLSSCESGIGKLQQGEGMMALHRAFLYAGASNIVYSLFKVPQDSTRQLVEALYGHILNGDNYTSALRKAKLELIEDEMMEPMDWAGFALVGG